MKTWQRILVRILTGIAVAAAVVYVGDYLVWKLRGSPMDTVQIRRMTTISLKGNKFAIDPNIQITDVNCSVSLFPQAGGGACWWLARHPEQVVQE